MDKNLFCKKFKKLCHIQSYIMDKPFKVIYNGSETHIKAVTNDFFLLVNGLSIGHNNLHSKQLVALYDIVKDCYIKQLNYGNEIKFYLSPIQTIAGISYTSSAFQTKLVKCRIERYWTDDKFLDNNSYKLKLYPHNTKKYEIAKLYVSDFQSMLSTLLI